MVEAAAIYCRISHDDRGEGLGVARQEDLCRQVGERNGWPVAEVYVDNDISAYTGKRRPAYERMLADLEDGRRDAVVCVDLDRLTRQPKELERFIDLADHHNVALANASGDVDLASSDGRFRARIMGAVARQESEKKSERLKREREQAARTGKPHGAWRPFGFEEDQATHRPEEAALIREAVRRLLAGESLRAIAYDWEERGVRAPQSGKPLTTTSLRAILTNPRIAGLRRHRPRDRRGRIEGEAVYEGQWEPIVDRATFERLQGKFRSRATGRRGRPAAHLLSGLLQCGRCGTAMVVNWRSHNGHRTFRYVCTAGPGRPGCGRMAVSGARADVQLRDMILTALATPELARACRAASGVDDESAQLTTDLAALEDRLEELATDYAEGTIGRREWLVARDRINEQIEAIRRTLERSSQDAVLAALPGDRQALRDAWDGNHLDWKRALLGAVLERVVVHPARRQGSFDPRRLELVWRI